MSCRVAMLRMERDGLLQLPPPLKGNGNGHRRPRLTPASDPQEPLTTPVGRLGELVFRCVETRRDSSLWNELIERHHYLGYQPLPGAQIRYLITRGDDLLAAVGFGASAWKVAPRDLFIGWTLEQRRDHLHQVIEKARFRGTCYRAANWIHVGQTQGRGKLDRYKRFAVPVKDVFLLPLRRDFRQRLRAPK